MAKQNLHTAAQGDTKRANRCADSGRVPTPFRTQTQAADASRNPECPRGIERAIRGRNGEIQGRYTYCKGPFPPRG